MGEQRAASSSDKEDKEEKPTELKAKEETEGIVDMQIFQQILDLDDEGTHEFSKEMVWAFFSQAEDTFESMQTALDKKDLTRLSSLGHFLKGSSATLGLWEVQKSCEKIQHYGDKKDVEESKTTELSEEEALSRITDLLATTRGQYDDAEKWLRNWYDSYEQHESSGEET